MIRVFSFVGVLALVAMCWIAFSSDEHGASSTEVSQDSKKSASQQSLGKEREVGHGIERTEIESALLSGVPDDDAPPLEALHTTWWTNEEFVTKFREEFPNFAAEHSPDWDEIAEAVDKNLENVLLQSGLLLEDRRLLMSDFESLSTEEKNGAIALLAAASGRRMSLGIDPFGERGFKEQEILEAEILADGLSYPPQAMVDALSYRTGRLWLEGAMVEDFAELRIEFLLKASRLQAQINNRDTAAVKYLSLNARESFMHDGFHPGLRMPDLDERWLQLQAQKDELAASYRYAVQNFVLENSSD